MIGCSKLDQLFMIFSIIILQLNQIIQLRLHPLLHSRRSQQFQIQDWCIAQLLQESDPQCQAWYRCPFLLKEDCPILEFLQCLRFQGILCQLGQSKFYIELIVLLVEATCVDAPKLLNIIKMIPSSFELQKQSWQHGSPNILSKYAMSFKKLAVFSEDRDDDSPTT